MTINILISKNLRFFKLSAHELKSLPNDHSFFPWYRKKVLNAKKSSDCKMHVETVNVLIATKLQVTKNKTEKQFCEIQYAMIK